MVHNHCIDFGTDVPICESSIFVLVIFLSDAPEPNVTSSSACSPDDAAGGSDLLTCGQCGQAFPLAHILTFIQHKQGGCSSTRAGPLDHTPQSPANHAFSRGPGGQLETGYVELKRTARRGLEEEPGVKAEPNQAGEFWVLINVNLFIVLPFNELVPSPSH